MALAILTGARDEALASHNIQHCDMAKRKLVQDARDVGTNVKMPMLSGASSALHLKCARLPYFNPHSFRTTLARLGEIGPLLSFGFKVVGNASFPKLVI